MKLEKKVLEAIEDGGIQSKAELCRVLKGDYDVDYPNNTIYRFLDVMKSEGLIDLQDVGTYKIVKKVS